MIFLGNMNIYERCIWFSKALEGDIFLNPFNLCVFPSLFSVIDPLQQVAALEQYDLHTEYLKLSEDNKVTTSSVFLIQFTDKLIT